MGLSSKILDLYQQIQNKVRLTCGSGFASNLSVHGERFTDDNKSGSVPRRLTDWAHGVLTIAVLYCRYSVGRR